MNKWCEVWENRRAEPQGGSILLTLLRADGYDTLGAVTEQSWRAYVDSLRVRLQLQPGDAVFDVGCGAGALLWCFREAGHPVGGIDFSTTQIALARQSMPDAADLQVQEAAALDPETRFAAVIACGTFLYFPDLSYADQVIERMAAKATRCLALLDLPDLAQKDEILRRRKETLGEEAYNQRYAGLDHLYFSREWVREKLAQRGLTCDVQNQSLQGYAHAPYRFNVFARKAND